MSTENRNFKFAATFLQVPRVRGVVGAAGLGGGVGDVAGGAAQGQEAEGEGGARAGGGQTGKKDELWFRNSWVDTSNSNHSTRDVNIELTF